MYKFDTDKVKGQMAQNGLIQPDVCAGLQISIPAFRHKMNGKSSFNVNEVCILAQMFNVEPGFLFTPKVSNSDTQTVVI